MLAGENGGENLVMENERKWRKNGGCQPHHQRRNRRRGGFLANWWLGKRRRAKGMKWRYVVMKMGLAKINVKTSGDYNVA